MNDPLASEVPVPAPAPALAAPAPESGADGTADLSPAELQTAIEALPTKGTICVLTPRVETLEKQIQDLAAAFEKLVPLLTAGKEFAERVSALEAAVAGLQTAAPAQHDARLVVLEDAVKALSPIAAKLEQHFGIKL